MNEPEIRDDQTVPQALGRLRVALDDVYDTEAHALGLTAQQAELLCAAADGPIAVGVLARLLRCDRSNVSRLVERLAKRDVIGRRSDDDDGRVSLIELDPRGHQLADTFLARLRSRTEALLVRWTVDQQRQAVVILTELAEALADPRGSQGRRESSRRVTSPSEAPR